VNKSIFKNRTYVTIIFSIIILFSVSITSIIYIPLFTDLSHSINIKIKSSLAWFKSKAYLNNADKFNKEIISDDILVVAIDEETYDKLWFPIPRRDYVPAIENINNWWAEVIGFDIIFANNNTLDKQWDDIFAKSISDAWNVILWGAIIPKEKDGKVYWIIEEPLGKFYSWALWFWYYKPTIDPITDIALKFKPTSEIYNKDFIKSRYDHFTISLLKAYYWNIYKQNYFNYSNSDNNFYYLRPKSSGIPFYQSWKEHVLINYIPVPEEKEQKNSLFKTVSFLDVYENKIDPKEFEWKIVIIWVIAKWVKDIFYTPNWSEYWVYVLSNILNTVLTKNHLIYFDTKLEFLLIFLLIVLSVYFNLSRSGYVLIFSNVWITFIFLFIFPLYILWFTNYLLNHLFELYLALLLSLTISNTYKYLTENKNKIKLNKALSEYVSKAVADEILSSSWKLNLDGEKKKLAIYFSDIEWFTTISEKFEPEDLVWFLREYLSEMSDIIMDENWFINKYEWDAIMALWWSFIEYDKWAYYSCLSAIKQQALLKTLNNDWKERWFAEIKVRIWIHTWEAIVWNIGSTWRKMEYTALWDSVNLASRLEWVNKFYWTYICVSEDIYIETAEYFEFRYLDIIKVKWKNKPIKIYELISLKWQISDNLKIIRERFEKGVSLYINREFLEAKNVFTEVIKLWDNASKTYLDMCEIYLLNPPWEDWDGVSTMKSK